MVQEFLTENMDVMHNVYPVIAKYYLTKRGLKITTITRRDVGYFSQAIRNKIEDLYSNYTALQSEIGIY
jgi:4-hydroxy-tetrahydrodipicolinate synthase